MAMPQCALNAVLPIGSCIGLRFFDDRGGLAVINRRERSKFTPSDVSEVRRRFDRILRRATENAETAAKHFAALKPSIPPAASLRRAPTASRRG
jgi:hypothetical protein